jgi:protocatechuate 3,4-dioxygenase beta subunit
MNRKDFLWKTGAAMLAFTLPARNNYAFGPGAHPLDTCIPTTADILGPYYRANAPMRSDLTISGDPGVILHYKGIVTDENCNPIANAIVDVWQANHDAVYDGVTANFNYRGKFQTGADGAYAFKSVKPGWYLNGAQFRPAHIHFRVTAAGYTELITQLYFEGDPYIADDPWASDPDAEQRIVPVAAVNGEDVAEFNITLKAIPTGIWEPQQVSPVTISPNPVRDQLHLNSGVAIKSVEVFSMSGQLITYAYGLNAHQCQVAVNYLGNAVYYCRIETEKGIFVHRFVKE